MNQVFNAYSAYYDLLYQDKDYVSEVAYIGKLLKRHGQRMHEILEFGSGTGVHGRLLAEAGFRVTGIELSQEMVDKAPVTDGFSSRQGDIRNVNLNQSFDAVLSLFHVMSYQITNHDIQASFSSATTHLLSGGLFVFDFWYSPAVYGQRPEVRVKRMERGNHKITRIAEPVLYPNENRIDVHYTVHVQETSSGECRIFEEVHPMRHFSLPEIDLLAEATGFERISAEGFLSGESPGEDTWGVCVILRKK